MKHLQLYEYYQKAPLTSINMVRLYRGDSDYIHEFDPKKFDPNSVYGKGVYLTDSRYIATTYTTKTSEGQTDKVITKFGTEGKNGKEARLCFTVLYVLAKLIDPTFISNEKLQTPEHALLQKELYEYYMSMTEWVRNPLSPPSPTYWNGSPKTKEDMVNKTKAYKLNLKERNLKIKSLKIKYDKLFAAAVEKFGRERKYYKFILTKYNERKNDASWEVWDTRIKQGHVSEFDVPKRIIDACYDAELPLAPEIMEIIKGIWYDQLYKQGLDAHKRFYKHQDKDEYMRKHMLEFEYGTTGEEHLWETLSAFFKFRPIKFKEEKEWVRFRAGMKKLGYKGIRYLGGKITGSPTTHNAYVLWDLPKLIRVR